MDIERRADIVRFDIEHPGEAVVSRTLTRVGSLAAIVATAVAAVAVPAAAAGIDSRTYSCGDLQALIARQGFVFISQATFGDFVVADVSFCEDNGVLQTRTVATRDQLECPVNYCVRRNFGASN